MLDQSFLTAGNATFTVANNDGKHYTYRIHRPDEKAPFFVQLLTGPDNASDYRYLGIYREGSTRLLRTKKSAFKSFSVPVRAFNFALRVIMGKQKLPSAYRIDHVGLCGRRGRVLTTPESIRTGFGPICKTHL